MILLRWQSVDDDRRREGAAQEEKGGSECRAEGPREGSRWCREKIGLGKRLRSRKSDDQVSTSSERVESFGLCNHRKKDREENGKQSRRV